MSTNTTTYSQTTPTYGVHSAPVIGIIVGCGIFVMIVGIVLWFAPSRKGRRSTSASGESHTNHSRLISVGARVSTATTDGASGSVAHVAVSVHSASSTSSMSANDAEVMRPRAPTALVMSLQPLPPPSGLLVTTA